MYIQKYLVFHAQMCTFWHFSTAVRLQQQCLYNGYVVNKSYKVQVCAKSEQRSSWYVIDGVSQMYCSKVEDEPISKNAGL